MIKWTTENDCLRCPQGCIDCGRGEYKVLDSLVCDRCGNDSEKLYDVGDEQICLDCILDGYLEINEENFEEFI